MIRVDTTATIDRPVEEVAAYLADIARNESGEVDGLRERLEAGGGA